ncbi:MAG: fecD [Elusimicrobia bacterium]|nr:MAG: fecD [Elusimicrobiota bacterium]KAF0154575.1 MAG: fecD [Elusimicrobiota bacterium]
MRIGKAIAALLALAACAAIALLSGPAGADPDIILNIRVPRVLAAALVGAALSVAGAILQGVLKNPLADPYIIGTSSGAMAGAAGAAWLGLGPLSPLFYLLVGGGGLGATAAAYRLARIKGRTSGVAMLLAGVAVSSFLAALVMLLVSLDRGRGLPLLSFLLGTVRAFEPAALAALAGVTLAGSAAAALLGRQLDILSAGEEGAVRLGVPVERMKLVLFSLAALLTAAAVAVAGAVGFVGLIVPHAARRLFGPRHAGLVLYSAACGAGFLMLADALARTAAAPAELPAGVITALAGAPFFLFLLRRGTAEERR